MKCPWQQTSEEYIGCEENTSWDDPIKVVRTMFGECLKEQCPFYGSKDGRDPMCLRTFRR